MRFDTIIANGTVVHAKKTEKADVGIVGEKIAAVGKGLAKKAGGGADGGNGGNGNDSICRALAGSALQRRRPVAHGDSTRRAVSDRPRRADDPQTKNPTGSSHQRTVYAAPRAFLISSVSSGTTLNRSPTMPISATLNIGASGSVLMATIRRLPRMPARC